MKSVTESSKPLARLPTPSEAEEMTTRYLTEGIEAGGKKRREREAEKLRMERLNNISVALNKQPPACVAPEPSHDIEAATEPFRRRNKGRRRIVR